MLAVGGALAGGGCAPDLAQAVVRFDGAGRAEVGPFAPATLRLHPLTRLGRDDQGRALIVCHIELADRWGDTTKGIGQLAVQLYRPVGASGQSARQDASWDIDLTDLELNASLYDPVTRTYRVQLGGLPGWVEGVIDGASGSPRGVIVRVALTTWLADGRAAVLRDELTIEP